MSDSWTVTAGGTGQQTRMVHMGSQPNLKRGSGSYSVRRRDGDTNNMEDLPSLQKGDQAFEEVDHQEFISSGHVQAFTRQRLSVRVWA